MNTVTNKSIFSFGVVALATFFLVVGLMLASSRPSHAETTLGGGGRLLTIYDRGTQRSLITQAMTVGDALTEAGVVVDARDAVEPSLEKDLVASDYKINIYRARPVTVVDGSSKIRITTPYQTAEQIAIDAGVHLYDEDIAILGISRDVLSGTGVEMTIKRAVPFEFTLYGVTNTVRTQAQTVGDMLIEKGISMTSDDRLSLPTDTLITNGLKLELWREGKQTITVEESIGFDVSIVENIDLPVSHKAISVAGELGKKSVTYEIIIQNGAEVKRTEIASITLLEPKTQTEVRGVKGKYNTPSENENIAWSFLRTQGFSRAQTAGIMGNLMQEHRFRTSDVSGGLGIAQWIGGRRAKLIDMYPDSYTNIYSQLDFLMFELNGSYVGVKRNLLAATSIYDAVSIFEKEFERCGTCKTDLRNKYAEDMLATHPE
jgi:uncharacterized protein YabE (DUF348 family)